MWGAEALPKRDGAGPLASVLLGKSGYAILRAGSAGDPRYLAFKFAPHGGGHGHYDKLSYVSFALGKTMALDPGTHSYAAVSHKDWDKTTIAHNTIAVDEQIQKEAAGNLRTYIGMPAFSLVRADAGAAYPRIAAITRTMALTADYWLDLSRASALDGKSHRFDWVYHNAGALATPLAVTPYTALPKENGYNYLAGPRATVTPADWQATWDMSDIGGAYGSVYKNDDAIGASFTLTRTGGNLVGQLDYDFASVNNGYAVFLSRNLSLPRERPTPFELRVFGDGSNNPLTLRVMDATGEKFVKTVRPIAWSGWQTLTVPIDKSWSHSAGNDDGVMDLPISQVAVQINRGPTRTGRVWVDDLALTFPSGRVAVEDFDHLAAQLQMRMLGAGDTTVVGGHPAEREYSTRHQPLYHVQRQFGFGAEGHVLGEATRLPAFARSVFKPSLGQIQAAVQKRVALLTGVDGKDAFWAVRHLAQAATVLAGHPGRMAALLGEAAAVHDHDPFRIAQRLGDELWVMLQERLSFPPSGSQKLVQGAHRIGINAFQFQDHRFNRFAFDHRQLTTQIEQGPLALLTTLKGHSNPAMISQQFIDHALHLAASQLGRWFATARRWNPRARSVAFALDAHGDLQI